MTLRHLPRRFLVAFSFAGEQRDLVRAVAELVERELGSDTVFLDEWFEYYIAGPDADLKFQRLYGERCELVVVCVSKHFGGKPWTQAEHEAVRARLIKARSLTEERERDRILPIRVGDGDVDGILFNTIVPDIRKMTVAQAAELIIKRLRHVIPDLQSASTDLHLDQERQKENNKRLQKLKKETMGRVNPITILHLSDMQFGKNHRFGVAVTPEGDNPYNTLRERLILDLRMLREDHRLVPDLMILTGDLTEWGMKPEFNGVLELIMGLEKELSLTRERLIVIPGNHDINRKACEAYFNECEADTIQPAKPYWAKWRHYVRFFGELYRDLPQREFTEAQPWTLFEIEQLKVVVAGLNSTIAESHRDEDHYGWVGEPQWRWFAEKLATYKRDGWLRIGAVHHNVVRGAQLDDENLRDAVDLKRILGMHLNCVLHGHTHEADMSFWIDQNVPILSTGSAVNRIARPDEEVPNQYQIIQFLPEHIVRYSRAYDPRGKEWIPDARIREGEGAGRQTKQIQFQSVHAAFPAQAEPVALKAKIINRLPMGGTIFISYRRDEDAGFAGRLFDRLQRTFRRKTLFMDVDSIAPGQDFVSILEARVAECDVLLALIGRGWLTATDAAGRRRLDNPDDFVRIEIATALTQAKRVIPVLIEDVPMPRSENLPEELKPLVRRQALRLSHDRFNADSQRLIRALKRVLAEAEAAR